MVRYTLILVRFNCDFLLVIRVFIKFQQSEYKQITVAKTGTFLNTSKFALLQVIQYFVVRNQ